MPDFEDFFLVEEGEVAREAMKDCFALSGWILRERER